jgi:predicted nucleic acid-binding protein
MEIFVDTSALYALVCAEDLNHQQAITTWEGLLNNERYLVTNNYVIVESISLFQDRFGMDKVRSFQTKTVPFFQIDWINEDQHAYIGGKFLIANRRNLSLVDCSAFESMRRMGISTVFAFDAHFREQGFKVIP